MTPRAIGTIARTVVAIFGAAVFGALSFAVAAGAQAPAKPSPKVTKPPTQTITITGPDVSPPIVIRSTEDPTLYAQVRAQVSWMKSATGNVMPSTPTQLGPHYTVTLTTGTTKTAVYDLYPLVATGPRAHRAAIGSQKAAWFFAPISMASALEAAGVTFPTSPASGQAAPPTVATSAPTTSFSKIMAQSKIALGLAAVAAAAVLVMLALAARRSRRLDRRRAMPAALARLETVAGRARGAGLGSAALATSGAGLRPAVPAARVEAKAAKATGTARVASPSQPTSSAPNAAPAPLSMSPAGGASAPVPPRDGPPLSHAGQSAGRSNSDQSGSGPSGPTTATAPVGSAPVEPPGGRPAGTWFGTRSAGQRSSDQSESGSAQLDRPDTDARPPTQRAAADAPVEPAAEMPVETPAEIAIGAAHVVTTAGTATAEPHASVMGTAKVTTPAEDRAVGVAPAPRAPADDVVEPRLGRPYVMPGAATAMDSTAVTPPAEAGTPEAPPTSDGTDVGETAGAEPAPAPPAPGERAPAEPSTTGQAETDQEAHEPRTAAAASPAPDDAATSDAGADTDAANADDAAAIADVDPVAGADSNVDPDGNAGADTDTTIADAAAADSGMDAADNAEVGAADSDANGDAADNADAEADADNAAVRVTNLDEDNDDGLDAADNQLPVTPSADDTDVASTAAETDVDSDATGSTAGGDPGRAVAAPAQAVPADSDSYPDGTATDAGPTESQGERP